MWIVDYMVSKYQKFESRESHENSFESLSEKIKVFIFVWKSTNCMTRWVCFNDPDWESSGWVGHIPLPQLAGTGSTFLDIATITIYLKLSGVLTNNVKKRSPLPCYPS